MTESLEDRARSFATAAHESIDQRRKWTDEPYIVHPTAVAEIVRSVKHDEAMIAAALLHDVVEDTGVPIAEIEDMFGSDVAELVGWLTDVATPADGDRATRKALNRAHSAAAPARAQTIKVADVIDNSRTVAALDPEFARVYLPEKAALVEVLDKADSALTAMAKAYIGAHI
ncbi:MAG: HD domain-containing protein [Beijerinckiaceae bacterium]|nr:HD domain-containing protein [Beijerinckiaceae bacterium]